MRLKYAFLAAGAAAVTFLGAAPVLADEVEPSPATEAPSPAATPSEAPDPIATPSEASEALAECEQTVAELTELLGIEDTGPGSETLEECLVLQEELEEEVEQRREQGLPLPGDAAASPDPDGGPLDPAAPASPLPADPNYTG